MDSNNIVKDSSIWINPQSYKAVHARDPMLRIGIVKKVANDKKTKELRYLVEVQNHNDKIELNCVMLRRFGGVYNYEDYVLSGYTFGDIPDIVSSFAAKAGDAVLVGQLNGQGREGVIIGGLTHAAHATKLDATSGPQYVSEFNGVNTEINEFGEFTVTIKGLPTNIALLKSIPSIEIPPPIYNPAVGGTLYKFDKTGGFELNDKSTTGAQFLKMDKTLGTMELTSGTVSLKMEKLTGTVTLAGKMLNIKSDISIKQSTVAYSVEATAKASIKAQQIAIGTDGIELLDQLGQLIDALGSVTPISPMGPCSALSATPAWVQITAIKTKLKVITGSF